MVRLAAQGAAQGIDILDSLPVQWYEGMLLLPHHFQQQHQYVQDLLAYRLSHASPFGWGINRMKIDAVTLVGGLFRLSELDGVFPSGLPVHLNPLLTDLSLDLKKEAPEGCVEPTFVHLIIQKYRPGEANEHGDFARYISIQGGAVVDEGTGDNLQYIPRVGPKVSLWAGDVPPPQYESIPLAQVVLQNNTFVLTPYTPPSLHLQEDTPLSKLCDDLLRRLRSKASYLTGLIQSQASQTSHVEIRETLRALVVALPPLEALVYTKKSHPFEIFLGLAHLVGQLSSLKLALPPVFDFYNHGDLHGSFSKASDVVFSIVDAIEEGYTVTSFEKRDRFFSLSLKTEQLGPRFVVGLMVPSGATEREMEDWVKGAVIVSESMSKIAQDRRVLGANRLIIYEDQELQLVPPKGTVLVAIPYDGAFIRANEKLMMFNLSDREDKRPKEVVLYSHRQMKELDHAA